MLHFLLISVVFSDYLSSICYCCNNLTARDWTADATWGRFVKVIGAQLPPQKLV